MPDSEIYEHAARLGRRRRAPTLFMLGIIRGLQAVSYGAFQNSVEQQKERQLQAEIRRWRSAAAILRIEPERYLAQFVTLARGFYFVDRLQWRLFLSDWLLISLGMMIAFYITSRFLFTIPNSHSLRGRVPDLEYVIINKSFQIGPYLALVGMFVILIKNQVVGLTYLVTCFVGAIGYLSFFADANRSWLAYFMSYFSSCIVALGAVGIAFVPLRLLIHRTATARSQSRYSLCYVVGHLLNGTLLLGRAESWTDTNARRALVAHIGHAATVTRDFLIQQFEANDDATREWQRRQALRIATGFADKQTWIMTPKGDTRDALLNWLAKTIVALVGGSWDELELLIRPDEEALEAQTKNLGWPRIIRRLLRASRTILTALVPPSSLYVAERLRLTEGVSSEVLGWIKLGVSFWAVVVLMFLLDPLLREKIAVMKDVVSVIRPGSGKE